MYKKRILTEDMKMIANEKNEFLLENKSNEDLKDFLKRI